MIARSTISLRDTIIKSCSLENYIQADEPQGSSEIVDRGAFAGCWNNMRNQTAPFDADVFAPETSATKVGG
jgi:hypothetical protein